MARKKMEAASSITISTREIALLIAGQRVAVDDVEIILEEAADDQEPSDIMEMVIADVDALTEETEDEDEDSEEESYEEDTEEDDEY